MATCGQGQQPYEAYFGGGVIAHGATPFEACNALSVLYEQTYNDGSYISWNSQTSTCTGVLADETPMEAYMVGINQVCEPGGDTPPGSTVHCTGTCTLVLTTETFNAEKAADMSQLFGAFVAVLVVVWGVKQLLNLFTGDNNGGA